ncbi:LA_3751/LA_3752 family putative glycosyltransferase [Coleofasciculus sp.]|uniref:LA_3751/LA_3752 family putative glycosyltransferase n=1 Tax=Coleofasciculus sp. TaxID=3100458 RepID=UPI003A13EDA1
MTIKDYKLPLIVIGVGILFSLYLQWLIPEGVFFSGDAGLKALLAKQLSQGQFRFDLVPPSLPWVRQLWQNGLYPFEEPFVYYINDRYFITFPFTFPLVTAPFQALFGYRGLYIIPLVSTWVIWLTCYWVCKRLELSQTIASLALIVLIFASPLTLYSAMYWEHTLALALAWLGLALFLFPRQNQPLSIRRVIVSGILIGGSVWFRPEFLALVSLIIVFVYAVSLWNWSRQQFRIERFNLSKLSYVTEHKTIFVISLIATVGLFFLSNKLIYNHPLGIHAIQVVEETGLSERLLGGWQNFQGLSLALF